VLHAGRNLVQHVRAAVIAEHRPERLLSLAGASITVTGGTTTSEWPPQPPSSGVKTIARETSRTGAIAWSLAGVSAGFPGRMVLDSVDIAGRQGEVIALSGPNGGGKTTLLRLIAGALVPLAGRLERRPGRIAYLPQNPTSLLHRPTLRSEVSLTLDRAGDPERPETILKELGLLELAGRYPRDLSCGERQRAALAAILPGRPEIVLLDEPTRGMDAAARAALVRLVSRLRDLGSAIVLATHDAELREALADRELRVSDGKIMPLKSSRPVHA
jgi:ABC-type multidrug transport system ATPase subunit